MKCDPTGEHHCGLNGYCAPLRCYCGNCPGFVPYDPRIQEQGRRDLIRQSHFSRHCHPDCHMEPPHHFARVHIDLDTEGDDDADLP